MASNINPYSIDGSFPIANQDNSSQGFRDNFTNIKNNFLATQDEISDLQSKALVTSALTGQTLNNNMNGTQIIAPQLRAWTEAIYDQGVISSTAILDFTVANFQKITSANSLLLSFINWPTFSGQGAIGYGVMRVWIVITDVNHTLTLPATVSIGATDLAYGTTNLNGTTTITFDTTGNYLFDFSSIDSGASYQIFDLSRNRSTLRDPSLYFNDQVNSTLMVNWRDGFTTALLLNQGQNSISSRGSYNSAVVGNLSLASLTDGTVGTDLMSGYTVTATRGNLSANVFTPVSSNDYLGYHNAITYTGINNTGNTFQQTASMAFFATGSNVTYGLGGNIAFFTKQEGDATPLYDINQAMGIESNQSVKIFGNLITGNTFVPTSSTTAGGVKGQMSFDGSNLYICIAPGNWKKVALTTF